MGLAFTFPGQGSQVVGMGQDLYQACTSARAVFDEADDALGYSLSSLCFSGPEETLNETLHTQPALFVTCVALWSAIKADWAEGALFFAGHSLGEYAALVAADALDFADGLRLVMERGRLMQMAGERAKGGMAAILGLDDATVEVICDSAGSGGADAVQVANYNCPGQTVISGGEEALNRAMAKAEAAGARKVVRLAVSIAAHSSLMAPAIETFSRALSAVAWRAPNRPVVGNVNAKPLLTAEAVVEELLGQLTAPVRWVDSVQWMIAGGVTVLVEVGPGSVLSGLAKRIDRSVRRLSVEGLDGLRGLAGA